MNLSEANKKQWEDMLKQQQKDAEHNTEYSDRHSKKAEVSKEMGHFLQQFLSGSIDIADFKTEYDRKTRKEWSVFGLKGLSGAMFLNMLVKYTRDCKVLDKPLKEALSVPQTEADGKKSMNDFANALEELIKRGDATRRHIQPARVAFFLSSWWHVQKPDTWPVFYPSSTTVLERAGLYQTKGQSVEDYFVFRDVFLSLASSLQIGTWELGDLIGWFDRENAISTQSVTKQVATTLEEAKSNEGAEADTCVEDSDNMHQRIQLKLAQMGKKFNLKVLVANNDRNKTVDGQRLGDLCVEAVPNFGLGNSFQNIVKWVDVIWMKANKQIVAAFEIENTTSIFSGILRMSDLNALQPNISFPLYIVVPEGRIQEVKKQLSRPTFQQMELNKICLFFTCERLLKEAPDILKWATDESSIKKIAERVEDVTDEEMGQ